MKTNISTQVPPPSFEAIQLSDITIHPNLPIELVSILYSQNFKSFAPKIFSEHSARYLIRQHPILVTKTSDNKWSCIAGFRSLQIAHSCLPQNETIWVMIQQMVSKDEIVETATFDLYLNHLSYSIDDRLWDVELAKIWKLTNSKNRKKVTPGLTTKKKLAELLDIPPQRLSTSSLIKTRSKQKKFLEQTVLFPSSDKKYLTDQLAELYKLQKKAKAENNISDLIYIENMIGKLKKRMPGNN